ncbi:hypothetical protein EV359DRAFT_68840, partial [Lentinula novae-zelandiae]
RSASLLHLVTPPLPLCDTHGLAQSGFGDDFLSAYQLLSEDLQQLSQAFQKLNEDMVYEIEHNKRGKMGSCSPIRAGIFRDSKFPMVTNVPALDAFLRPATSSSQGLSLAQSSLRLPMLPDIPGITNFCTTYFAWSEKLTLEHLHMYLWSGVVMQMLCSTQIETDGKGKLYMPTLSTSIRKSALNFHWAAGNTILMTFSTTFFLQLTNLDSETAPTSRRLDVPVEMLAVAANCWGKVVNLSQLIGSATINAEPSGLEESSIRPVMSAKRKQNGTHSRGNSMKCIHLGIIELTEKAMHTLNFFAQDGAVDPKS